MSKVSRLFDGLVGLHAFARTRWGYRFSDRSDLERYQKAKLERFIKSIAVSVPFFSHQKSLNLDELPVMNKETMQRHFSELNRSGIDLDTAMEAGLRAERERDFKPTLACGITVGLSSGTSGRSSVFLANNRERSIWAGTVMARVLSSKALRQLLNPFSTPLRVAFFLRANSNLYTTVRSARLHFQYGDLLQPFHNLVERLNMLQPHLLIAPASVLRQFALAQLNGTLAIRPMQIISVAEVLESDDAHYAERAWGTRTGQLYQCTEGFLGFACEAGRLHLNEEFVHIEPDWLDNEHQRFVPIVTDFTRCTQAFVRYRLDDILQIDPRPCLCGRVTRSLTKIEGRQDDVLWLPPKLNCPAQGDSMQAIFPDVIRRAFLLAQERFVDYRLEQNEMVWLVRLEAPDSDKSLQRKVLDELAALWRNTHCDAPEVRFAPWTPHSPGQKRRRIRCIMPPRLRVVPS